MITITNKNIYYSEFSLSTLSDPDKVDKVHIKDIVRFLSDEVQLGETVTFGRIFEIVSENVNEFNEIFYSSLGGHPLEPFLQEIQNNPTETIESDFVEVHWFCDKYENDLSMFPSLHGVSSKNSDVYALDFVSLNNLKDNIIKLNRSVEIFDYNNLTKNEIMGDNIDEEKLKKVNLGNKSFTLFDLFNAIFYEISFHGGPQDKKERWSDLEETMEGVSADLDTEKDKGITFEEMIERLDSSDKYLVKYKELRDRVDEKRIQDGRKLSKLKNCLLEKLKIYDVIENSDENLDQYYKKLTDLEYNMQILYGEQEDIDFHRFWDTPKCTCPKIDNVERYPTGYYLFDKNCPIHGK